ncbi:MAG: glycosyltransferase [Thermodesulfobacteriota bacterium]
MNSQSNILVITQDFQELGHVFIYRQITALKRFRPVVITWKRINSDKFPYDAVEKLRYPRQIWKKVNLISHPFLKTDIPDYFRKRDMRRIMEKYRPALVHIHFGWMASEYLKNYHTGTAPLVVTFHGFDIMTVPGSRQRMSDLEQLIFRKADKLIFVSNFLKDQAIALGCPAEKAAVNYLGAPVPGSIVKSNHRDDLQAICIARFVPCKGHRFLLEAVKRAIDKGLSIKLDLIGDGLLRDRILWDIERLGLKGSVNCLGTMSQDGVYERLLAADLYIQPSVTSADGQTEALGISIAEGMASGLPVIATRTGGIPELVVDGVTGILVDEYDTEAMANAIVKLSKDAAMRNQMGNEARNRIIRHFSVEDGASSLEKIYESVIENRKSETNFCNK